MRGAWFASGRMAIRQVLLQHTPPSSVCLVPEYHCLSVADAVRSADREIRYYRIDAQLAVDLDSLEQALTNAPVSAVIFTHFFSHRCPNLPAALALCAAAQVLTIEDAAHVLPHEAAAQQTCDVLLTCPRKFYPTFDGALLESRQGGLSPPGSSTAWELRALKALFSDLFSHASPRPAAAVISAAALENRPPGAELSPQLASCSSEGAGSDEDSYVDPRFDLERPRGASWVSRRLTAQTNDAILVRERKRRFTALHEALAPLTRFQMFGPTDNQLTPYMVPVLIDQPEMLRQLRNASIAALRWEDFAPASPVAENLRQHLIQLPCHQGLSDDQFDYMVAVIKKLENQ